MRQTLSPLLVLSLLPCLVLGQATSSSAAKASRASTLLGAGNSFSGVGLLADFRPFERGPISFMASVGSVSAYFGSSSDASVALALGVRANAGHGRHQGFAELAVLPVDDDVVGHLEFPSRVSLLYGLGLQLGYRASIGNWITVNAMGGAGYALSKDVVASRLKPLLGFGVGFVWPRH